MEDTTPLVRYNPRKSAYTFGLEIEFALATMPESGIDPEPYISGTISNMPDHQSARNALRETLKSVGISAEAPDLSVPPLPSHRQSWILKDDVTIRAPDRAYSWIAIELCSPALYFTPGSLEQVRIVLETLAKTYRINCNRSCGLHVHVGNALRGFSVQTIRKLMATIWTFEPQVSTVHPEFRIENQEMAPNFRKNSVLSEKVFNPRKSLDTLLSNSANTIRKLNDLSEPVGNTTYKGGNKLAYYIGDVSTEMSLECAYSKRTVEFREHASTLNKHAVQSWIEFCVRLVEFADDVSEDFLYPFLRQHIEETPEQYSLSRMLCKLGMPELAEWYPLEIARREAQETKTLEWNQQRAKEGKPVYDESDLWLILPPGKLLTERYLKPKKYGKPTIGGS